MTRETAGPREEISIRLNGEPYGLPAESTLTDLLVRLDKDPRTVAIELDGDIVPRALYGGTRLAQGAAIEIVQFVQGG